jgi:hypothetical protein
MRYVTALRGARVGASGDRRRNLSSRGHEVYAEPAFGEVMRAVVDWYRTYLPRV